MDIAKFMPDIMKHIKKDSEHIAPDEKSHTGLSVPGIVLEYGSIKSKARSIPNLGHYMIGCIMQLRKSYRELYKQPKEPKLVISDRDLKDLIAYSKELGAGHIRFAEVDNSYIFSNKVILYKNAIVLSIEMKHEKIKTAPSKPAEKEIFRTYYRLNYAANKIKAFLNERGYNAQAGPALGGEVNYPLLAQKAGIGAIGKHGMLITPNFGPSLRLAVVYTDIRNLAMAEKNDHMWIAEFCKTCNMCVKKCPAQAIYEDSVVFEDGTMQHIDYKKCAVPFSKQRGCTVCVKECVFFKSDYEKIKAGFMNKTKE